jgi:hypothetical protein
MHPLDVEADDSRAVLRPNTLHALIETRKRARALHAPARLVGVDRIKPIAAT